VFLDTHHVATYNGRVAVSLRHRLEEEDYRGERYANHHKELKGNNDLLVITKPEVLMSVKDGSATPSDQHAVPMHLVVG
jgi:methionine synthase I (cobalamin-dependent)